MKPTGSAFFVSAWAFGVLATGAFAAVHAADPAALEPASLEPASRDWTTFRGPLATGEATPGQAALWPSPARLEPRWTTAVGSGYSGVSIAGNRVVTGFAADGQDWIGAFDLDAGGLLWKVRLEEVYTGHDGSHDGPIATPAIAGSKVVALSTRGVLVAVDLVSGEELWRRNLGGIEGAQKPHYGHGSSPIVVDGLVVVSLRVEGQHSVVALDLADGSEVWAIGDDSMNYQSPMLVELGGQRQVVALSDAHLWGLEPKTGAVLWSYEHHGDYQAAWAVPLPVGKHRLFLHAKRDEGELVQLTRNAETGWQATSVWITKAIARTYAPPAYHDGVIYGYSGSFLSAVDVATGARLWRSRPPGDGFLAIADDRLVVLTKQGTLHLAATSRDGWKEIGATQLFEGASWTPPSIAGGRIVARGIGDLAVVDVRPGASTQVGLPQLPADSQFAQLLAKLAGLPVGERGTMLDAYLAEHAADGPLVEGDRMIFLYRGEGTDLGITGSMIGQRAELPMVHIEGTNTFWWATTLPVDARVEYQFVQDYEVRVRDDRNPRLVPSAQPDPPNWAGMPGWQAPAWVGKEAPVDAGRLVRHELAVPAPAPATAAADESAAQAEKSEETPKARVVEVWLPPGYDTSGDQRYPVAYVHLGDEAVAVGKLPTVLDHAVAAGKVKAAIVVFVHRLDQTSREEFTGDLQQAYRKAFIEQIIPLVDSTYRTKAERNARANVGFGFAAHPALLTALEHRELFGRVALQSAFMLTEAETALLQASSAAGLPIAVDLEWGQFDLRAEHEGWDARATGQRLSEALRKGGNHVTVRTVSDGFGWGSWPLRADLVFGSLFGT